MIWWNVTTENKNAVTEHISWEKDGSVIRTITRFPSGYITVGTETDQPPMYKQIAGTDAVNMFTREYDFKYQFQREKDGWWEDIIWPDNMLEEEKELLLQLWKRKGSDGWTDEGWWWEEETNEVWFHGPLEITVHE